MTISALRFRFCTFVVLVLLAAACSRSSASSTPQIQLNSTLGTVDVIGLPPPSLRALSKTEMAPEAWQQLLRVSVKQTAASQASHQIAVAGRYSVVDGTLRFTPMFPFDDGREYEAVLTPSRLPGDSAGEPWRQQTIAATVGKPAVIRSPSTVVSRVYPSGDEVPANHLRMYLHFSAPMDWRSGFDYVRLLDDRGQEVADAFLPLDADFWNDDRTRYTVFFDPGRVKRGILPNRQMGRALEAGRRYTLLVKREWRDGHGLPLKEEFTREFRATPAIERALTTAEWKIDAPTADTRDPLVVTFPAPLDYGLLQRALGVARTGTKVEGDISIEPGEKQWRFTPKDPWPAGEHQLVALAFLEDLAGNRIGRPFEVDDFERTDRTPEPERHTVSFRVERR